MFETMTTVVGTVVTHPLTRDLHNGDRVLTFRLASTSRRIDPATGEWIDSGSLFLTVTCWRRLAAGVEASIRRGDPIMAYGQVRSHEYRAKDGGARRDLEMRAHAIGPDLSRCSAQVVRRSAAGSGPSIVARNTCDRSGADGRARDEQGEDAVTPAATHAGPSAISAPVDA